MITIAISIYTITSTPSYQDTLGGGMLSGFKYDVTQSFKWLEKTLNANRRNHVIIALHDADVFGYISYKDKKRFRNLISKNKVSVILVAHQHEFSKYSNKAFYDYIPVFVSDALFNGGYYYITYEDDDQPSLLIQSINGGTGYPVIVNSEVLKLTNRSY